jgi:NadR type nicotinamide-nucleotide adenylyltransferase
MIDTAIALSDHVVLLVYTMESEPICGFLRFQALSEHYLCVSKITIKWIEKDLPPQPDEHPDFWDIWRNEIQTSTGKDIDCIFGSEDYVKTLGDVLECKHYIVDIDRKVVPTSGTACRNNTDVEWENIIPEFRKNLVKKIAIVGGESVGKSTLTKLLATAFKTNYVSEYGREHCLIKDPNTFTTEDFIIISKTQQHLVSEAIKTANKFLFCDTETVMTQSFHKLMLGDYSIELSERIMRENYHHYFVLAPSIPFFQDGTRLFPDHGQEHFQLIINLLNMYNKSYTIIYEPDITKRVGLIKNIIEKS